MANLQVAENLCPCTYQNTMADLRMTVAVLFARSSKRDPLQDRDVVTDLGCSADNDAGSVINEDAAPDRDGRVNVDLEYFRRPALKIERERLAIMAPQPVRRALGLQRLVAFVIEKRLHVVMARRIAIERCA